MKRTCQAEETKAKSGLLMEESEYPKITIGFLFPILSENQPENILSKLAVLSAIPSISPTNSLLDPRTSVRKTVAVKVEAKGQAALERPGDRLGEAAALFALLPEIIAFESLFHQ